MRKLSVQILAFITILIITIGAVQNPFTSSYVKGLKNSTMTVAKQMDSLYIEIKEKAPQYKIPAQNAEVHKVWKATPGYNGLQVDIEASYENMKKEGNFDEKKLVLQQVQPNIHLSDLPPSPIYRGHPDKPMVAFLINVAWGTEYIPSMLEILNKHKVKATFFLEGRWVKENPDLAKMIVDAGFEVGNHSYSHPNLRLMGSDEIRDQLVKTNDIIQATTNKSSTLFAPPSGSIRDEVVEIASELNMGTIMWSVDTIDWQRPEPHVIVDRVITKVHKGAMILMHPTSSTTQALETLILSIKQKELQIVDVTTLLSEERILR
ncbi:polysaccharide deacetylase family protein [Cytobacillus sp. IB215665]|uniref:polysaccharide deacetylase family protein n=1 Tax=Cytobacillus sp. IB215665 TaxID=3097357 RepID=UPI002A0D2503|nr:polysaccharide deacetylase family protein [Cytobacillus sp. IB215665]MDX8365113.1 polysaccharide deacetylase family protein [Cytobacillus sp. IB215665]